MKWEDCAHSMCLSVYFDKIQRVLMPHKTQKGAGGVEQLVGLYEAPGFWKKQKPEERWKREI